jgi:signal transduction histidine kinase/ActR/RegA family two-component response regulator
LASLDQLFSAMPADTGMAFVVVQHPSPDVSVIDQRLARHTAMPVVVGEDETQLEPDHIYLLPPRTEMVVRGRRLMVAGTPTDRSLPIDILFRSLAQDVGPDAVGIVLSGCGSDGSHGVADIERAGGTVMIESPEASPREIALQATVDELRRLNEGMQSVNDEYEQKIRTLLESTAEAERRREQFLAMLSHELRNPLAAVLGATTVLSRDTEPPIMDRCVRVIERQSRHMARLLDDLLDVSRITRGTFELRALPIDLRTSIEGAIEATTPLFEQRGVTLDVSIPSETMPLIGDQTRLQQVVVNLLSNAATFSVKGSRAELHVEIAGEQVILRVVDRGVGIEPEMLGTIFDLFVQAEQRLDRSRGGLGVGLSLAKNIVELHGGSIEARSEGSNMGSELLIRLPIARSAVMPSAGPPSKRHHRRRVVIVEDQADAREMLRMLLESLDHIVLDASDGAAGLELIQREKPDAALIDIGLPEMSGYEVAQRIREHAELDRIKLVALTGYGGPADVSAARSAGFDAHLIKPADLARIQELLADVPADDGD